MILDEEFLSRLRTYFSLNLYEVKIWTALLSQGEATAGELSEIASVPRSRSYDVLESLEKKGFVIMKFGKPIKYLAVDPSNVVERVKNNMRSEADVKIKRLDKIGETDIVDELKTLHSQGIELVEPSDISGRLKGRENLYNHMEVMIKSAEKSVVLMTTSNGFIRKIEGLKPAFESAKKRGVDIKIAAHLNEETRNSVEDMKGIADIRHTSSTRARFVIIDGKEIMFMVIDDEEVHPKYDVGIWVNTPFFASALADLFDEAWKSMTPSAKVLNN